MTPLNASLSNNVPTAVDIPVDNPARDPGLVVKRGRKPKYTTDEERKAAIRASKKRHLVKYAEKYRRLKCNKNRARRATNPEYRAAQNARRIAQLKRGTDAWQRLKRIAKARGVTPEELLDGMERADG